jgi:phosphoglycerate dehydrogenase-like enzyme/ASC-1-like (ASCH) protein
MRTKTLWIKEAYLRQILDGRKTVEVRVAYSNITLLQTGDRLSLNEKHLYEIRRIGRYANFVEMLEQEDSSSIAPDTFPDQLLDQIRAIYPPEKEQLGAVALEIKPAPTLNVHLLYDYGQQEMDLLRSQLQPGITLTVGKEIADESDYHVLVGGRPDRRQLAASPILHTLIVPWVGIPLETSELLAEYPHIAVHNLHHNAAPTAELAIALLFAATKFIIPYDRTLRQNDWSMRYHKQTPARLLDGKTALVLGYGAIGKRVAQACRALGMSVLAVKRKPAQASDEVANEIHPAQDLHALLPRADALLICLPLTAQTEDLIGEKELAMLPANSVLVNVSRGPIVNETALYNALRDGQLHAAGIDVWYNYPSNKESRSNTAPASVPFHELDNVVMSPHRGGHTAESGRLRMPHLANLLNNANEGKPLPNKVDLKSGY